MTSPALQLVPLFAMLALAAGIDVKSRRIPNWLTASILMTGVFQSLLARHLVSPAQSMAGVLVGFSLPFVLFVLNAIGGGDVKLLAAVGAWVGPVNILLIFVLKDIVGLVIVLAQATRQGKLKSLARNSAVVTMNLLHVREVGVDTVRQSGLSGGSVDKPLPMAVPILVAVLLLECLRPGGFR